VNEMSDQPYGICHQCSNFGENECLHPDNEPFNYGFKGRKKKCKHLDDDFDEVGVY
jgi:hypothetical protein